MVAITLAVQVRGVAQGTFVNLDFEHSVLPLVPVNFQVPITNAMPGWTGYIGGVEVSQVIYDSVSLGSAAISFHDSGSLEPILQGSYTVLLQPGFNNSVSVAIAQAGQLPQTAASVRFYGSGSGIYAVSFAGHQIPLLVLGTSPTYTVFGGDISAYANQTGELRFQGDGLLDNVFFSSQPIPEPGVTGLLALGGLIFCRRFLTRR